MGCCFSYDRIQLQSQPPLTANVVSISGDLRQYKVPVCASQVLEAEAAASSSSSSSSSFIKKCFLCNSDRLYYDDYIPKLDSEEELQANQIYFVLPNSKLGYRLTASDMAALAVKASVALQNANKKDSSRRRYNKSRISPVLLVNDHQQHQQYQKQSTEMKHFKNPTASTPAPGMSRSPSVRKFQRYSSRRAKMAVRSFRLGLSTIYEGTVV
ncbi:DUF4228 domain-containing protein [Cephalotus follicularis]|uniref:DUF4228 domain-containing protein n=1 Tax=Cephalotus follicularis TaxID=3775 RepID=A0A1Q3BDB0_CEPFO|nr:DUF4228 domain-containing protein [Cephalotus follicularis]